MRIPNNTLVGDLQRNIDNNRSAVNLKYLQISSGKKYLNRSDDPLATNQIANTQSYLDRTEQWTRNLELAENWEMASEAKLSEMVSSMQRARELVVEANTGVNSGQDRQNIAIEIDAIIDDLVTQMNAEYSGTPMFAGKGVRPTDHTGHWNSSTMGTQPAAGDFGMPAAVAWDDLSQVEYQAWYNAQMSGTGAGQGNVAGNTMTIPAGTKDWDNFDMVGQRLELPGGISATITGITGSAAAGYTVTVDGWQGGSPAGATDFETPDFAPGWVTPNQQTFTATRDANGQITTVTYNGSANSRQIQVYDKDTTIEYGTNGADLTNYIVTEYDSTSGTWNNNNVNLFDTLIRFRNDLQQGNISSDTILNRLDEGLSNVITRDVENGVSQNRIKSQLSNAESNYNSSITRLSDLEDVDVATAISEMNEMQAALQASLQMINQMNSLRIINFL